MSAAKERLGYYPIVGVQEGLRAWMAAERWGGAPPRRSARAQAAVDAAVAETFAARALPVREAVARWAHAAPDRTALIIARSSPSAERTLAAACCAAAVCTAVYVLVCWHGWWWLAAPVRRGGRRAGRARAARRAPPTLW